MIGPILLALCALAGLASLAGLGLALARIAGLAESRTPAPHPSLSRLDANAPSSTGTRSPAPTLATRTADYLHDRILAESWRREGRLSPAGYQRLCDLMDRGLDVYPYWSGGALHGTAVVWDGTRGHGLQGVTIGERVTVEEWNAQAAAELLDGAQGAQDSARGGAA